MMKKEGKKYERFETGFKTVAFLQMKTFSLLMVWKIICENC